MKCLVKFTTVPNSQDGESVTHYHIFKKVREVVDYFDKLTQEFQIHTSHGKINSHKIKLLTVESFGDEEEKEKKIILVNNPIANTWFKVQLYKLSYDNMEQLILYFIKNKTNI